MKKWDKRGKQILTVCFLVILILYPLRHVRWGLDFWDTGYNYANYTYASPEHMGIMWWFSTYLANLIGHLFTLLPGGNTLVGLNVYTGLLVGGIAALGYWFCTKKLGIPALCAFAGEMGALSMCWCPSAKLYDYLTYLFFLLGVICLYRGLTEEKRSALIWAGVCLGVNLFIRFSNLTETGLILAVWGYAFLKEFPPLQKRSAQQEEQQGSVIGRMLRRAGLDTLWCVAGYLIPLGIGFGWIAIRYGIGTYFEAIRLLFAMTENATDYQASSMVYGLLWPFWEGKYWVLRILLFFIAASLLTLAADYAPLCLGRTSGKEKKSMRMLRKVGKAWTVLMAAAMIFWLLTRDNPGFTSFLYETYDPIFWPGTIFLTMAMGIGAVNLVRRKASLRGRLLGGMIILILLLTSLGSNNGVYPSFNNLFLAGPYVLHELTRFTVWAHKRALRKPLEWTDIRLNFEPSALLAWALTILLFFEFGMFGLRFCFAEGTGMKEHRYEVTNNRVLKGVQMEERRAVWMEEISAFALENGLSGQEVILYGQVPALSFYLEMPPAISAWSDLRSYQVQTMRSDLEALMRGIDEQGRPKPLVIAGVQSGAQAGQAESEGALEDPKWRLIREFMEKYGYEKTFDNQRFVVWQAK